MEGLIEIVNKLQDIYAQSDYEGEDLPQIAVVGMQSSGKSSVLEHIVGKSFLPRGPGLVTRCPLVLQMVHTPGGTEDCAIFSHIPTKKFTDNKLISQEIEEQTERLAGTNQGICKKSINLRMLSSSYLNLTLIDLPGIVKVPVGDQPPDIEQQVKSLIYSFISKPNCLILAVTAANTDLATSESIKIAAEVDENGNRTLAVLTKLDLMDSGTDAWDMLQGKVIPVKLGIIGVVNRSQKAVKDDKSIIESLKDEEKFFKKYYPSVAHLHGCGYLTKAVQGILINHIKACLPNLKTYILEKLPPKKVELAQIEAENTDKTVVLHDLLSNFSRSYVSAIKGNLTNVTTDQLYGGARINSVFRQFANDVSSIKELEGISESHILTTLHNASGVTPAIFVPEVAFEQLVKKEIEKFTKPSLTCVERVFSEMKTIVLDCIKENKFGLERYFKLQTELETTMTTILEGRTLKSNEMVLSFIDVQRAYINIAHPEFIPELRQPLSVTAGDQQPGRLHVNLPSSAWVIIEEEKKEQHPCDKSIMDLNLIKVLIKSYYAIVRKTVQDTIPKIVMYSLVNIVMERLERELVLQLGSRADELLAQSQLVIEKKESLRKEIDRLENVKKAVFNLSSIINERKVGLNL